MTIDYSSADKILILAFAKLDKPAASLAFPACGSLATQIERSIDEGSNLPHDKCHLLASASVEMWHRAIHSFLWSVALTPSSKIWASVSGYYASHFAMRAYAHALGIFKSFRKRKVVQIGMAGGTFVCTVLPQRDRGEHSFYWRAVKQHPRFAGNPLFSNNNERDNKADCAHRNFANYIDHIDSFRALVPPNIEGLALEVEKISRIRRHSVAGVLRDNFPDLQNVQILAYQRIVVYREFLDERVHLNRFWKAHRTPQWCKDIITFELEDESLATPELT